MKIRTKLSKFFMLFKFSDHSCAGGQNLHVKASNVLSVLLIFSKIFSKKRYGHNNFVILRVNRTRRTVIMSPQNYPYNIQSVNSTFLSLFLEN